VNKAAPAALMFSYEQAACLVSTDDESYTYNNRVNRLSTIQEHYMIRRVIDRGVSPERLAKALSVDVSQIMKKMSLLDGVCPEGLSYSETGSSRRSLSAPFAK
jgi:hypothetical protein